MKIYTLNQNKNKALFIETSVDLEAKFNYKILSPFCP